MDLVASQSDVIGIPPARVWTPGPHKNYTSAHNHLCWTIIKLMNKLIYDRNENYQNKLQRASVAESVSSLVVSAHDGK